MPFKAIFGFKYQGRPKPKKSIMLPSQSRIKRACVPFSSIFTILPVILVWWTLSQNDKLPLLLNLQLIFKILLVSTVSRFRGQLEQDLLKILTLPWVDLPLCHNFCLCRFHSSPVCRNFMEERTGIETLLPFHHYWFERRQENKLQLQQQTAAGCGPWQWLKDDNPWPCLKKLWRSKALSDSLSFLEKTKSTKRED